MDADPGQPAERTGSTPARRGIARPGRGSNTSNGGSHEPKTRREEENERVGENRMTCPEKNSMCPGHCRRRQRSHFFFSFDRENRRDVSDQIATDRKPGCCSQFFGLFSRPRAGLEAPTRSGERSAASISRCVEGSMRFERSNGSSSSDRPLFRARKTPSSTRTSA